MTRPRRNSHRDGNQQEIVDGLRRCGLWAFDVSAWFPFADVLVYGYDLRQKADVLRLFEIKTATGKLTDTEREMQERYPGLVQTARTLNAVLAAYGMV